MMWSANQKLGDGRPTQPYYLPRWVGPFGTNVVFSGTLISMTQPPGPKPLSCTVSGRRAACGSAHGTHVKQAWPGPHFICLRCGEPV